MSPPPLCCVDPGLLRRALRLVHCLQKERGASCAYYASRHEHNIVENMERARVFSDRAIQMMLSNHPNRTNHNNNNGKQQQQQPGELKIQSTLMKIRKMVQVEELAPAEELIRPEGSNKNNMKKRSSSCHRILVCFNALISSIVHDFFMEKIALQEKSLHLRRRRGEGHGDGPSARDLEAGAQKVGHRRAKSHDCFADALPSSMTIPTHPLALVAMGRSAPKDMDFDHLKMPASGPPGSLPGLGDFGGGGGDVPTGEPPETLPAYSVVRDRRSGSFDSPAKGVQFEVSAEEPEVVLTRLLNLLACFVKLKESTGVERAILSSLVVLGKEDPLLLSDLVLEVENQRRLLDELKKQPFGSLRNLVEELVEMSQPLRELQQKILKNFDLEGIIIINDPEHDVNKVWDLITVYIDKLHSLELLIIEEIEYCLPSIEFSSHGHDHHDHHHHNHHNGHTLMESEFIIGLFGASASEEEVRSRLETMPAEEIKERLLQKLAVHKKEVANGSSRHARDISLGAALGDESAVIDDPLLMIPNLPASKEWEINLYELKFLKRIGEGAAGTTYLANWTGLKVAVKVASITEMGLDGWRTEVKSLQKLHHPNVIRLLGSVYHQNPLTFCLVLEYCNAGDLGSAMKYPTAPGFFFHVATSIAKGIAYLHSRGVMHRDIKPDNILCDGNVRNGNFQVKVSDFGVATDSSILGDRTAETGTYRWMSPEVIRHESYSNMADVYSYAVVLWQLITREDPYMNVSQIEAAGKVALEKARPPFPRGTPAAAASMIQTCWSEDPTDRWPFEGICDKLSETESKLSSVEQTWMDAPLGHPVYYPREEEQQQYKKDENSGSSHHVPIPNLAAHKKKEEKAKEDKKKSGFFKIKMFGH